MKLEDLIDYFVSDVCAGKSNETPIAYRRKLQHLINYLGADCDSFGQEDIDKFRRYLLERDTKKRGGKEVRGKLSKFTVRTVLATTRHFLKWAAQRGKIPTNLTLPNIKEPSPDPKAIEPITVNLLLKAAAETGPDWERARNAAIIYVLRDTGGRVGAVSRIDLDNLYLEDGYACAPDKGDQMAWLYFNEQTIKAIQNWIKYRYQLDPKDYLLWTGMRGYGLSRQGIGRVLSRLAHAGGATGRHNAHAFRHAFARDTILAGADLGRVSQLMGHSNVVVTDKYYSRWTKRELKEAHRQFSPGRLLPFDF